MKCKICGLTKNISEFDMRADTNKPRTNCKLCRKQYHKNYYTRNATCIKERANNYRKENIAKIKEKKRKYYNENKERIQLNSQKYLEEKREIIRIKKREHYIRNREQYLLDNRVRYAKNKEQILEKQKLYAKKNKDKRNARERFRKKNDPVYMLRTTVSSTIYKALKRRGANKKEYSSAKAMRDILGYTTTDLKQHLEMQFEPWMNWQNYGAYNTKTWDDNDTSTWTWNIDHIVPQSSLPFASYNDLNFKKVWALENLRPYSAKQNVIENNRRYCYKLKP